MTESLGRSNLKATKRIIEEVEANNLAEPKSPVNQADWWPTRKYYAILIRGWVGVDENLRQGLTTQLITARQQQAALAANKHGIRSEESQVQAEANSIIRQTRWHKGIDRLREEKAKLELTGRVALQLADSRRSSAASQQADTAKRPFDGNLNLKTERFSVEKRITCC
ncbi:proteasome subunit alpha type [Culex quinquefasciatus]|uniref:Proteasome subunit alpha type n=1 Tax=Culex quinquefasciatus TaxID=7176 RepID=B0W661_CULQU|nr:proteasome subunit alpha type [Culex quinquefasciatus]|eukprot:XP_001844195.1 proteasome subunit alpha type [Culex quinquefasciatus]